MPRAYEHATFHGKRDFADVIKVKDVEMEDYLGLSGWTQFNLKSFKA